MICIKALVRQVEGGEHHRALARVLENGRDTERDLSAWVRANPGSLTSIALGLALTRLAELTYGPTDEGSRLAERLMSVQDETGWFGSSGCMDPVGTAVALSGLLFHTDQYRQVSQQPPSALTSAVDRAARALAEWVVDQPCEHVTAESLQLVRRQLDATAVLGITARDMMHDLAGDEPASGSEAQQRFAAA